MHNPPSPGHRPFRRLGDTAARFGRALGAADDALFSWLCHASEKGLERGLARFDLAFALTGCLIVGAMVAVTRQPPDAARHRGRVVGLSTTQQQAARTDHRCTADASRRPQVVVVAFPDGGPPRVFEVPDEPRWAIGDEVVAKRDGCGLERWSSTARR